MFEQIEKVFPGFLTRIRQFPAIARAALVLMILTGPAGLAWFYTRVSGNAWLRRELRIPPNIVSEYWSLRGRLREDVFRVGEEHLCANRSVRWEALKKKNPFLSEHATPFSFLLDRGQPIAEWNLHHDQIWEALFITDEFVEYLRFRHPTLKRITSLRNPALCTSTSDAPR